MGTKAPGRCSNYAGNCTAGDSAIEPYVIVHHVLLAHAAAVKLYREKYQVSNSYISPICLDFKQNVAGNLLELIPRKSAYLKYIHVFKYILIYTYMYIHNCCLLQYIGSNSKHYVILLRCLKMGKSV